MKAIITVGVSASGKSTAASGLDSTWFRIERDAEREKILCKKLFGQVASSHPGVLDENLWRFWKWKDEKLVDVEVNAKLEYAVVNKLNIIVSDTNLNIPRRESLQAKLEELGYEVEVQVFGKDLSMPELWKRDLYRKNSVGHQVIAEQYDKFRREFPKYQLKDVTDKPTAVIFDVDGTLSNGPKDRSPFEWDKVGQDEHNELLFISMIAYFESGYNIIIMSGRDEVCRKETQYWISEGVVKFGGHCGFNYEIFMRPKDDQRKDSIIKTELFFAHIDGVYNVVGVFDDRPQVVTEVWLELGFKTYSVGNPHIHF